MTQHALHFQYYSFENLDELPEDIQNLIKQSIAFLPNAYAPYSHFQVACSVLLSDGTVHVATNQENASYPVGSCAEQVVLKYVGSNYKNKTITAIAVTAKPEYTESKGIATPCGMCRQCILEYETKQQQPIQIYLVHATAGNGLLINKAADLLPIGFEANLLK